MQLFLKYLLIFLSVFILLLVLFETVTSKIFQNNASFLLERKPEYIVVGNSHSECAFNDSLISNFSNLSISAESYFYTFQKVKKILEQNKSIKTVFIEFNNNQIGENINEWIWGDIRMSRLYPMYSPFMTASDKFLLLRKNPDAFLNAWSLSARNRIGYIMIEKYDYSARVGGYMYLDRDKTDSLVIASRNNTVNAADSEIDDSVSETNIQYLLKTISLCKSEGKDVFLVRSPVHELYSGYKTESIFQGIIDQDLGNVEFLDFSRFPLQDSEFGDFDHLNYRGALVFSEWFNRIVSEGILLKPDRLELIRSEIDSLKTAP